MYCGLVGVFTADNKFTRQISLLQMTLVDSRADTIQVSSIPLSCLVQTILPIWVSQSTSAVSVDIPGHDPPQPPLQYKLCSLYCILYTSVLIASIMMTWHHPVHHLVQGDPPLLISQVMIP